MGIGGLTLTSGMSLGTHNGMVIPNGTPSALTAIVISDTSIQLDWLNGATNKTGTRIYGRVQGVGSFVEYGVALGSLTTKTLTGLTQGTTYEFYVKHYKGIKESIASNTVSESTILLAPSSATSQFIVNTILGQVDFTDNSGGTAQHEIYSNTNGAGDVLLTTLNAGVVTYNDITCKQNASVVYKIRAKKGALYSDYITLTALVTPLCWKTNQTVRTNVVIQALTIAAGKTVNIDWGDGTNANYTGTNTNITKTYSASAVNVFNIKISGDTNSITTFNHNAQSLSYGVVTNWVLPASLTNFSINYTGLTGVVTNWVLPASLTDFYIHSTGLTGVVTNWVLPASLANFYIRYTGLTGVVTNWVLPASLANFYINSTGLTGVVTNWVLPASLANFYISSTGLTGSLPQITAHATNGLSYQAQSSSISDSVVTVFRKAMTVFNISNQNVVFSTANIDKVLKALADWYQNNAPTADCTYTMNGNNNGIPTGGASNTDLVRLAGYYTSAGRTATIVVRTS